MPTVAAGAAARESLRAPAVPTFQPARWLRNRHLQTIVAAKLPRRFGYGWTSWQPETIDLGAGGCIVGEASWQPGPRAASPALFLLHGLEGSAQSHYLVGMSKKAYAAGFHAIRINTRNCGGTEHLTPTLYCAGLSQDVEAVVGHLRARCGVEEIYAAGVSIGANILLKYLGEQGARAEVRAAAVLSPPIDLARGVREMEKPQNWIYQRYFVTRLIARMRRKCALFPGICDLTRVERVRSIYEFDDLVTAPHFGYGTADNYYRLASSAPLMTRIEVPTLIVAAEDDPIVPFGMFRDSGLDHNPAVRLLAPRHGGHSGFLAARAAGRDLDSYWGECRAIDFLAATTGKQSEGKHEIR